VSVGTFKVDSHAGGTAVARRAPAPAARQVAAPAHGKGTAVAKAGPGKSPVAKAKPQAGSDDGEWEEF